MVTVTTIIKALSIHGFRNLEDVWNLMLKPFSVLVDGNGTEKSPLLPFFEMPITVLWSDAFYGYVIRHDENGEL